MAERRKTIEVVDTMILPVHLTTDVASIPQPPPLPTKTASSPVAHSLFIDESSYEQTRTDQVTKLTWQTYTRAAAMNIITKYVCAFEPNRNPQYRSLFRKI